MRVEGDPRRRRGLATGAGSVLLVSVLSSAPALSGQEPPMEIVRLSGPVSLDGVPDEEAWSRVPPLPLTMYAPVFRGAPDQRTEIRVAYDDEYLYAAGWFWDDEPQGIRINSLYRDRWNGDDAFAIYVDAFNDNRNAKWFGTTPSGMRFDLLVSDDGATLNDSWDTFWDVRSTVSDRGWFSEVRIPFSSLGFRADSDGRVVMGLTVTRLVSRTGERVTFPEIDPRFEFRQPSVARDVVLTGVHSPTPLYVTPYLLSGVERRQVRPEGAALYRGDRTVNRDVGLDVRYALSSRLTLDLTARTDFAQVEADEEQVNLDRFPLFFPEKRRFFQENSGLFDYVTPGGARLFHSRRIGLTPGREPVPVIGGARLVGRAGGWDLGLLTMQTEGYRGDPTENFSVARLRRRILNPFSFVGLLGTSRLSSASHNLGLGADGQFRLFGDEYLTVHAAATEDDELGAAGIVDRSLVSARWQRRVNRGLAYTLEFARSGPDFLPELGFLQRRDFTVANLLANRYTFTDDHALFRRVWPGMLAFSTFRNSDGVLESGQYAVWLQWETKSGGGGWIEPKLFRENVAEGFLLGGEAEVPAGAYTFADLQLNLSMSSGRRLRTGLDLRSGTYFDGTRTQLTLTPTWNASRHLELSGRYRYSRIRFGDRGVGADLHLALLRIRTALDARASGNAFVQYNSTTGGLDVNVRLRYNFAEGTDLWIVYNEGLDMDRTPDPDGLLPPRSAARSLIVKYSHTFGR